MSEDELAELLDKRYRQGERQALIEILWATLKQLGYDAPDGDRDVMVANLVNEREMAIKSLRRLCEDYGDDDWPDNLWLPDILEKHLANHFDE